MAEKELEVLHRLVADLTSLIEIEIKELKAHQNKLDDLEDSKVEWQIIRFIKDIFSDIADIKVKLEGVKTSIHASKVASEFHRLIRAIQAEVKTLCDKQDYAIELAVKQTAHTVSSLQAQVKDLRQAHERDAIKIKQLVDQHKTAEVRVTSY